MNFRNVAAFLTGYAAGYSLIIAGIRFAGLLAVNYAFQLGIPIGFLVLGVYAAHSISHTWQQGVTIGGQRHKQKAVEKVMADAKNKALAEAGRVPYDDLAPEHKQTLN